MKTWIRWMRSLLLIGLIGCGLLFFTILKGTLARILSPALETQNAPSSDITSDSGISSEVTTREYDIEWEREKWRIVEVIKEKLEQSYPFIKGDRQKSVANSGFKTAPFTICIVPATLSGSHNHNDRDDWLSNRSGSLIEELDLFWVHQHGFLVVERDRMDFVLRELEMATSKVSEGKLQFALGKILGARGILFVRVFCESGRSSLFSFNRRAKVFVRYVDTETSGILAIAEESFQEKSDLKRVSQSLGEKILRSVHPSLHPAVHPSVDTSSGGEVSNE